MSGRGVFITFEGGEGVGKTTQADLLRVHLEGLGHSVHMFREPGGTSLGDEIRRLLLDPEQQYPFPRAELLLYEASRAQLVEREMLPRLKAGATVVCDRFTDSTLAYQSFGRDLDESVVRELNAWAAHGLVPDLTFLLDATVDIGMERATLGGADRLELELDEFHVTVRRGFLTIAEQEPDRVKVIDADRPRGAVATDIVAHVDALLADRATDG